MEMSPFLSGESILPFLRIKYSEFNISFKKEKFHVKLKVHPNVMSQKLLLNNRMSKDIPLAKDKSLKPLYEFPPFFSIFGVLNRLEILCKNYGNLYELYHRSIYGL